MADFLETTTNGFVTVARGDNLGDFHGSYRPYRHSYRTDLRLFETSGDALDNARLVVREGETPVVGQISIADGGVTTLLGANVGNLASLSLDVADRAEMARQLGYRGGAA